jgi:hypothetical protein
MAMCCTLAHASTEVRAAKAHNLFAHMGLLVVCCLQHSPQRKACNASSPAAICVSCIDCTPTCFALLTTILCYCRCRCCCRHLAPHAARVHLLLVLLCDYERRVAGGAHGLHDSRSQEDQPRYCRVS